MTEVQTHKATLEGIREDLSFMRSVSDEGSPEQQRKAGAILVSAGLAYSAASVATWGAAVGAVPASASNWTWPAASVVFAGALILVMLRSPSSKAVRDRAAGLAWGGLGGAIFSIILGFIVIARMTGSPAVFAGTPTVILALYGAAWMVAAGMSGRGWMRTLSLGSYAAAVSIGFLIRGPEIFLAYAAALSAFATAPGLVLLARKR